MSRNGSFMCFHLICLWSKIKFWGPWRDLGAQSGVCIGEELESCSIEDKALILESGDLTESRPDLATHRLWSSFLASLCISDLACYWT